MGVVSALAHISLLTSTWSSWFSLSSSPPPLLPPASSVWLATLTELLFPLTSLLLLLPVLTTSVPWLPPMELPLAMLLLLSPLLLLPPWLTPLLPPLLPLPWLLTDTLDPSTCCCSRICWTSQSEHPPGWPPQWSCGPC